MKSLYLFLFIAPLSLCLAAIEEPSPAEEAKILIVNEHPLNFGVQLGLNVSNAALDAGIPSSSRAGVQIGGVLEVPLTPGLLYLQPEMSFVQRGAENATFGTPIKARLNYLETALLAKLKINVADAKPFALAGPRFGYLLNASGENSELTLDRSRFSSADLGFDLGGGIAIATNERSEVYVSARYSFSWIDADPSNASWKSEGFLVNVGYLF